MKKRKNTASKGSKRRQKVQKGRIGDGGVATAPRQKPFLTLPPLMPANHGLGHVSVGGAQDSRDHEELTRTIRAALDDFMSRVDLQRANADPVEVRRAKPFALAYASAVLAFRAGTLQKKRWGAVRQTLRRAWFRYVRLSMAGNSPAGLNEFLADQSKLIVDIPLSDKPEIPSKAFSRIDGLIYRDKKHRPYLAMTPSMVSKHLNLTASRLKKLKTEGMLHAGKHLQTRLRLRFEEGREKRESFYLFSITTVPDHAQPFNEGK